MRRVRERRAGARETANSLAVAILTVSDERVAETDVAGRRIAELARGFGHQVLSHLVLPGDEETVARQLVAWVAQEMIDVVVVVGGVGVGSHDVSADVVEKVADYALPGFGELVRLRLLDALGASVVLLRPVAGIAGSTFVCAIPDAPRAIDVIVRDVLGPQLDPADEASLTHVLPRLREGA